MDPIEIESTVKNSEEILPEVPLQSIHYKDIGLTYKFIDSAGETWFHQIVGEWMLGVRTRQFDYYCKNMVPPVIKRREQTSRYSYNFVKESDIHRIAQTKGKVLRMPLQDIPTTDSNEKIFSKTDVETGYKKAVNELALAEFKNYDLRINDLVTKNDHLNAEVNRLTVEKAEIIETKSKEISQLIEEKSQIIETKSKEINQIVTEKHEILEKKTAELSQLAVEKSDALNKKRTRELWLIAISIVLVIGGGVAAVFIYNTNKDNDRLYEARNQDKTTIVYLNTDDSNLKVKVKDLQDQVEVFKKLIPTAQNAEINPVKKD